MFKGYCTFLLIDIVDSSNQFEDLHDAERQKRLKGFFEHLENLATQHGFQIIDKPGDAAVLVDQVNDQNGDLLALMMDVYVYKRLKEFALRAVAHHVHLRFEKDAKDLPIYSGKEVVRTFRSEKAALKWELLVSDFLYQSLDEDLDSHKIRASGVIKGHDLTGHKEFQSIGEVRRLQFPLKLGKTSYHKHFAKKLTDLWHDVQKIKVFGGLYPDVDMADSFINLSLEASYESRSGRGSLGFHDRLEDRFGMFLDGERPKNDRQITAVDLLDRFNKGLILGLPGAGKTTMLRNLAFRLLSDDRDRGLILVKCRDLQEPEAELSDHRAIFRYLTIGYMGSKTKSLDVCTQNLLEAWEHKEAVILIDALDEAPSDTIKQAVKAIFETLQREIVAEQNTDTKSNRIFFTSRPAEYGGHHVDHPVFHVNALDSGQITDLARYFLGELDETFKEFRLDLPKTPYAVMVGSTPLTALLIIVWYQVHKSFELRYATYDLLMKFVLHKTWDLIKDGEFSKKYGSDLKPFLDEIKNTSFAKLNPEACALYEVLADLSFASLYDPNGSKRDIGEKPLTRMLQRWLGDHDQIQTPKAWIKFLKDHHIIMPAGHERYQFLNSTIMEFLAGRDLVAKGLPHSRLLNSIEGKHESLETLPIICSHSELSAYTVLGFLKRELRGEKLNFLAYRCLVETEALELRYVEDMEYEVLRDEEITRLNVLAGKSKSWIYHQLGKLFEVKNRDEIKRWKWSLDKLGKLSLDVFLEDFLPIDWQKDAAFYEDRKELIFSIYSQNIVDRIYEPGKQVVSDVKSLAVTSNYNNKMESVGDVQDLGVFLYKLTEDYLMRLGQAAVRIFGVARMSHAFPVQGVAFNSAKNSLASCGFDGTVRIWSLDGKAEAVFPRIEDDVFAFSWGQKEWFATGDKNGKIRLWNRDGLAGPVLEGHDGWIRDCAWGPNNVLASVGEDQTVRIWNIGTGRALILRGHDDWVLTCAWGSKWLATGDKVGIIRLWSFDGVSGPVLRGHNGSVLACAWSPTGLLATGGEDRTVRLWNVGNKDERIIGNHDNKVFTCSWSPDGELASGSSDGTIKIWSLNGKEKQVIKGHNRVNACAWGPEGYLVSGDNDGTVRLWYNADKESEQSNLQENIQTKINSSPLLTCSWGKEYFVSGGIDGEVKLWNVDGSEVYTAQKHDGSVLACAWGFENRLISCGEDGYMFILNIGGSSESFKCHEDHINACSFGPGCIATGGEDGRIYIWSYQGKMLKKIDGNEHPVLTLAWGNEGLLASGGSDNLIRIWPFNDHDCLELKGHKSPVLTCNWGQRILASGDEDGEIYLWSMDGSNIASFKGHEGDVSTCVWGPGGRLATGGRDGLVKLWDIEEMKEIASVNLYTAVNDLSFDPKGSWRMITANNNTTMVMIDWVQVLEESL